MTIELLAPFTPKVGGGGVITARTGMVDQAVYWELVSYDPITDTEGAPYGTLRWNKTKTNAARMSANFYLAPTNPDLAGMTDRIKVRCVGELPAPPVGETGAFYYHFDRTLADAGGNAIELSINQGTGPAAYGDGLFKSLSAVLMDGTLDFITEASEALDPSVGAGCCALEVLFYVDDTFTHEDWPTWLLIGQPDDHSGLPILGMEWWNDNNSFALYAQFSVLFSKEGSEPGYNNILLYTDPDVNEEHLIVPGNWYHVGVQYDNVTDPENPAVQIFVNGVKWFDVTGLGGTWQLGKCNTGTPDNRFVIGYADHDYGPSLPGRIDLARLITGNIMTEAEWATRYAALQAGA